MPVVVTGLVLVAVGLATNEQDTTNVLVLVGALALFLGAALWWYVDHLLNWNESEGAAGVADTRVVVLQVRPRSEVPTLLRAPISPV